MDLENTPQGDNSCQFLSLFLLFLVRELTCFVDPHLS